jgi:hypothetical protein
LLAAQLQQWPDAGIDLFAAGHQLGKVAHLVQPWYASRLFPAAAPIRGSSSAPSA